MAHDNETLVERIRGGFSVSENMQSLYEGNLSRIRKFIKPFTAYECEADLLKESYFGLVAAVQHYETSKNVRFSTYMKYWIVQSIGGCEGTGRNHSQNTPDKGNWTAAATDGQGKA